MPTAPLLRSSTISDVVRRAAAAHRDRVALRFADRSWTYRELDEAVTRAAGPLRHVGASPDRIALVLVLTIRAIPLLARQLRQVTEARKARGLGMSIRALVVPTVLGALTTADQLGDALAARGVDD